MGSAVPVYSKQISPMTLTMATSSVSPSSSVHCQGEAQPAVDQFATCCHGQLQQLCRPAIRKATLKCKTCCKHSVIIADGPQQKYAATLLNEVCGEVGCQFVLGMGDNFYPCGADAFDSGLNRFVSGEQSQASPSCVGGAVVCCWQTIRHLSQGWTKCARAPFTAPCMQTPS